MANLKKSACVFAIVILFFLLPHTAFAEQRVIYVAGNPDLFPVEYYNEELKQYDGVMPEILKQISETTGIVFEYMTPSPSDERVHLIKNKQVELVSGFKKSEMLYNDKQPLMEESPIVMEFTEDGKQQQVCFAFTSIAPAEFKKVFNQALSQIDSNFIATKTASEVMQHGTRKRTSMPLLLFMGGIILLFIVVIAMLVLRNRKHAAKQQGNQMLDAVTGIGNRLYFEHFFHTYINEKNRAVYAVVYAGIDVENTLERLDEHELTELLIYISDVLTKHCGETDTAVHLQRGKFAVAFVCSSQEQFEVWMNSVAEEIRNYSQKFSKEFAVKAHFGVYFMKNSDVDLETVLFNARQSYKYAASHGLVYAVSNTEILNNAMEQRTLRGEIQSAMQKGEFQMFMQFFYRADSERIVGAESLVRWFHPTRGRLSPNKFIKLIEKEEKAEMLDLYMLDCCCRQLEVWNQTGVHYLLSCNFSRTTSSAGDLLEKVQMILGKYHFAHEDLIIEITEESFSQNEEKMLENMRSIKQLGCRLALDDLGSGYTSFKDISYYPFDIIKIDKSIIDRILEPKGRALAEGIIKFAHSLELEVICEGIETKEQADVLREMGGDYLQGYYYHRPVPEKEANRSLSQLHI